jgi:ArsR family transcriptional regulator
MLEPEILFRALSDRTRLQCLLLLYREGRLCVCEFVHALEIPQTRVSRHLGHLRDLAIVQDERRSQWVHYRLHPDLPSWALEVLETVARAQGETGMRERLAEMPNRPSPIVEQEDRP